jgi:archaellum biogenesis ATPase FlaH
MEQMRDATFGSFGKGFQESLAKIILEDSKFATQIGEVLDINFFELKYLQEFVRKIYTYKKKYKKHPATSTYESILKSEDSSSQSEIIRKQVREFYVRIKTGNYDAVDEEFVRDKSLDFCRKQTLQAAMLKSVKLMQDSSFDEVSKIINEALKLGINNDVGYDFLEDFERRFELKSRNPVTTGWGEIDRIVGGGLGKGELGVVIAPTGVGKSMVLAHLGAEALKIGKNVVHYTLELQDVIIGNRYDSCLTGIPINDLFFNKEEIFEEVKKLPGKLLIKEYPTKSATTQTLKNHLEKLKNRDFSPDMIIVDYGDILKPIFHSKEKRENLETIYEELRAIAQEFECPVWTASQTNRSGINAEVITMESISEAFSKCFVADFIFSVSRTGSDKTNNTGRIYIAKNRNGIDGVVFPIFMDPANVEIKVFPEEAMPESEDNGPRKVYRLMKEEQRTKQTTKGE